jgi:non-haem Fe2+, alpha-ketoglutarate-dependent halogenase
MKTDNLLLSQYRQDGAVFPIQALQKADVNRAYEEYLRLCVPGQVVVEGENRLFGHLLYPWVAELVSKDSILNAVRALIGPNVLVWVSEFNSKAPGTQKFFSWHQDLYYWRHHYEDPQAIPIVTVWLALSDAGEDNGGMRILPGSHTKLVEHENMPSEHNLLTKAQSVRVTVDESQAIHINLAPGEFSIHHPLVYHASAPNSSEKPRVGLVIRYMAPEVVPPVRPAYAWLVSGEDKHNNWDHVAPSDRKSGIELRHKSMESVSRVTGARFR